MHQQSITSEVLEQEYLQFLKDSTHDVVKFTVNGFGGKGFYELNFRGMVLQYISFKCEIKAYRLCTVCVDIPHTILCI